MRPSGPLFAAYTKNICVDATAPRFIRSGGNLPPWTFRKRRKQRIRQQRCVRTVAAAICRHGSSVNAENGVSSNNDAFAP